ncbi:aldo/keto reductase [Bowmanella dokdonensis]|uniref:Aldo/keto reductase n=1 Tax=Bowmanella dokdonensis TaxID=751969 RepID=A0A939DN85_9ALTE|nr:aldo/keto reductase [Bowmanella dokdonensis]MBN7825684.1 aldo/keto reductase [Bowmanella dokdonensis]
MQTRTLGRSGYQVSEIGLGCWQLGNDFGEVEDAQAVQALETALEMGINFFDTADVYGGGLSEERIGRWLKNLSAKPLVATKVGRGSGLFPDGYSKQKVRESLQGSARRLGVEALDLAQLHCVPPEVLMSGELLGWMEELKQEGLIRAYGASVEMLDEALFCCDYPGLTSVQIIFNLLRQDAADRLLQKAADNQVGVIVRLPLASGLLSGRMHKDQQFSDQDHRSYNRDGQAFHVGETFNGLPYQKGIELVEDMRSLLPKDTDMAQLALRWILDHPQVSTVIAGSAKAGQIRNNAGAAALEPLTDRLHGQLNAFYVEKVRQHIRGGI